MSVAALHVSSPQNHFLELKIIFSLFFRRKLLRAFITLILKTVLFLPLLSKASTLFLFLARKRAQQPSLNFICMKMRGITSWKQTSRLFCLALMLVFMIYRHIGTFGIQDQFLVFLKSREFLNDDLRGAEKSLTGFHPRDCLQDLQNFSTKMSCKNYQRLVYM